jgi:hypothetical protein
MRRNIFTILVFTLFLFCLCGCGPATDGPDAGDGDGNDGGPLDKCVVDNSASKNTDAVTLSPVD